MKLGRALRLWLRRPARTPRPVRAGVALILAVLALIGFAAPAPGQAGGPPAAVSNPPSKSVEPPGAGDPVRTFPSSAALAGEGYNLYQSGCSSCHGIALNGTAGVAPSLRGVGAGAVDFYLSTGRMPLESPREEPQRAQPLYTARQIDALIAYITKFGGPPAPTADPSKGDLAVGLHAFTLHCAGCHQSVARGGLTVEAVVPNLQQATAQQVAEAVRMGPYVMPHFDSKQISQHELDSLARYVLWTRKPSDAGGWGIYNLGPIPEGMVAWFMALAAMVLVARLIGERTA